MPSLRQRSPSHCPCGHTGIQRGADKALFAFAGLSASLSPQCQRSFAPVNESWKCAMSQYLFPFIEQPTLVLQSSYDLNQVSNRPSNSRSHAPSDSSKRLLPQLMTGGPRCITNVGPLANLSGMPLVADIVA